MKNLRQFAFILQIVHFRSYTHRMNYKLICLSVIISKYARENFGKYRKTQFFS